MVVRYRFELIQVSFSVDFALKELKCLSLMLIPNYTVLTFFI